MRLIVKSRVGAKIHYILNRVHYLCKKLTKRLQIVPLGIKITQNATASSHS